MPRSPKSTTYQLINSLQQHKSVPVRIYAAHELGNSGTPVAVAALVDALQDPCSDVRRNVAQALTVAAWQPQSTYEIVQFRIARHDWEGCIALGAGAVNRLIAMLSDSLAMVRWNVVRALGLIGDDRAITPLITVMANDPNFLVQRRAIEALQRFGTPRALEAVAQWYRVEW